MFEAKHAYSEIKLELFLSLPSSVLSIVSGLRQYTSHLIFAAKKVLPGHADLPLVPGPGFASTTERYRTTASFCRLLNMEGMFLV